VHLYTTWVIFSGSNVHLDSTLMHLLYTKFFLTINYSGQAINETNFFNVAASGL
jgi:hypothetical protein